MSNLSIIHTPVGDLVRFHGFRVWLNTAGVTSEQKEDHRPLYRLDRWAKKQ